MIMLAAAGTSPASDADATRYSRVKAGAKPEAFAGTGRDIVVFTFTLAAAARCLEPSGEAFDAKSEAVRFAEAFGLDPACAAPLAARLAAAHKEKMPAVYFTSRLRMLCSGAGFDHEYLSDMAARLLAYVDDGAKPFNAPRFALAAAALPALGREAAKTGAWRHFDVLSRQARELAAAAKGPPKRQEAARGPLLRLMKRLHPDMYVSAPPPALFAECIPPLYEETRQAYESLRASQKRKRFRLPVWFSGGKRKTMVPLSKHG